MSARKSAAASAARQRASARADRELREALAAKSEFSRAHFCSGSAFDQATAGRTQRVWGPARLVRDSVARAATQIHAIGIGRKVVNQKHTHTVSVRIYVTQKLPKALVPREALVPAMLDGVPTDVIESAPAYLAAAALPPACSLQRTRRQRPLRGGISAAHEAVNAGTLAALCHSTKAGEGGLRFVLGNNHTFTDLGSAPIGSAILQPSVRDGGVSADRIANLARFVKIIETSDASNLVDAAIAELVAGELMQPSLCTLGAMRGTAQPVVDATVQKHGRTTGFTAGIIDDPSVDVIVPLSRAQPDRVARFVNQIRIRPKAGTSVFAQGGDSGALVTTRAKNKAVGLLFACPDDGTFAYANPIAAVLTALEIELE